MKYYFDLSYIYQEAMAFSQVHLTYLYHPDLALTVLNR